jgi:DNA-binding response OmpR family regulator
MTRPPAAREGWLIVEDEPLVAILIEDAIREMGLAPRGPASSVAKALRMIAQQSPEGALLDLDLGGREIYPAADALAARGIPFAFVTGYGAGAIRFDYAGRPALHKPFEIEEIQDVIRRLEKESIRSRPARPDALVASHLALPPL